MQRKVLGLAVAAAAVGAFVLHTYLARYENEVAGGEPTSVLVITQDIGLGETLSRANVSLRSIPERYLEERHIRADALEKVLGARVTTSLGSGGSLLWSDLDMMQEGRTLAGLVRIGMRAFALSEQDVSFDGLLRPGDRVDVVFNPQQGSSAQILLANVLVLTVGTDLGQEQGAPSGARRGRVTLSVTPEQATLLAHKENYGRFRLALRNPQDALVKPSADAALHHESGESGDARRAR